ncbi:hypothetical protein D3C80_1388760 [compost metagenome]
MTTDTGGDGEQRQGQQPEQRDHHTTDSVTGAAWACRAQGASMKLNTRPRLTDKPKLLTAGVLDTASSPNDSQVVAAASKVPSRLTAAPPTCSRIRMA